LRTRANNLLGPDTNDTRLDFSLQELEVVRFGEAADRFEKASVLLGANRPVALVYQPYSHGIENRENKRGARQAPRSLAEDELSVARK